MEVFPLLFFSKYPDIEAGIIRGLAEAEGEMEIKGLMERLAQN